MFTVLVYLHTASIVTNTLQMSQLAQKGVFKVTKQYQLQTKYYWGEGWDSGKKKKAQSRKIPRCEATGKQMAGCACLRYSIF